MPNAHVLVIDDEPDIRSLLAETLGDEGYRVSTADGAADAGVRLAELQPELILLDIWMPGTDGIALLRGWAEAGALPCPVVMMSGHGSLETAVEAIRLGAWDFIEKPISLAKLLITLQRALEADQLRRRQRQLEHRLSGEFEPLGEAPAQQALRAQLQRLAAHDTPVLLLGEPGTRKESLARWLHAQGPRREQPFVTVAAGAIADEQAASTLFGSEEAGQVRPGLLEQATGGSLFLDEFAALGAELQLRLSAALERRQFLRVGGRHPVKLDARLIAASSDDPNAERAAGRLREELYYLVAVVPVPVPALRQRREDIAELAQRWADHLSERDGLLPRRFSTAAVERLQRHDWPGNLRELRNLVQRLLLNGRLGPIDDEEVADALGDFAGPAAAHQLGIDLDQPLREARDQFERLYLQHQLHAAGGSVGQLAKRAGMERTHLYRKLKELGVEIRAGKEG